MTTTPASQPGKPGLRDRFRGIRQPWRDVWSGMASVPTGALVLLIIGGIADLVDPCEGLGCLWPLAVIYLAGLVLAGWLVIAALAAIAEAFDAPERARARTVRFLAIASWLAVPGVAVAAILS